MSYIKKIFKIVENKNFHSPLLFMVLTTVLVINSIFLLIIVNKYNQIKNENNNYQKYIQLEKYGNLIEVSTVSDEVSKLMDIFDNSKPAATIITNADKLSDQTFFNNAKNGDWILIYPNRKSIILYDSVNHKIVNTSKISIDNP